MTVPSLTRRLRRLRRNLRSSQSLQRRIDLVRERTSSNANDDSRVIQVHVDGGESK